MEVAEIECHQVVVEGLHAAVVQLKIKGIVEFFADLRRSPDHEVAAVIVFDGQRLVVVREVDDVELVALAIGGDVLGVYAYPLAGDELFEFVLDVPHLGACDDFFGEDEEFGV